MVNEVEQNTEVDEQDGDEGESTPVVITEEQRRAIEALQNKNVAVLTVTMPPGMRDLINQRAKEDGDKGGAAFAREVLANAVGFTLTEQTRTRAKKYATEEEKAAANKAKAKARRQEIDELLALMRAGNVSVS